MADKREKELSTLFQMYNRIQMFGVNMTFISSREVKIMYIS